MQNICLPHKYTSFSKITMQHISNKYKHNKKGITVVLYIKANTQLTIYINTTYIKKIEQILNKTNKVQPHFFLFWSKTRGSLFDMAVFNEKQPIHSQMTKHLKQAGTNKNGSVHT